MTNELTKVTKEGTAVLALADSSKAFAARYGKKLQKYAEAVPSRRDFDKLIDGVARTNDGVHEELAFALSEVLAQTQGDKIGMFAQDEAMGFPELRVYHGSGNDTNRPDTCRTGQYYLNTKELIGDTFVGAVIAVWKGRTMWGDKDAGESTNAPLCQSMDRVVGSTCGECANCPDKPWRDGQKTRCSDDVVAFMLTHDCKRLVLVRFAKTSTKTGNALYRNVGLGSSPWAKWWALSLDKQTKERYQWYNIVANPAGETDDELYTPEVIHEFAEALSINLSAAFILPGIARTYAQSAGQDNPQYGQGTNQGAGTDTGNEEKATAPNDIADDDGDDENKYGAMPDEEETPDV